MTSVGKIVADITVILVSRKGMKNLENQFSMFRNFYESYKPQNHRCHSLFKSQPFDDVTFHHAFHLLLILKWFRVFKHSSGLHFSAVPFMVKGQPRANVFKTSFLSEKASFCQK